MSFKPRATGAPPTLKAWSWGSLLRAVHQAPSMESLVGMPATSANPPSTQRVGSGRSAATHAN
eukprot:14932893-Alexandrium_andersonii.AAC.1